MPEAARAATLLAAGAIVVLAAALLGGGAILLVAGGRPVVGVLAIVVGLAVAAGGLLFTLSPRVAEAYGPDGGDERAENEER